jgi:hypothetical protein
MHSGIHPLLLTFGNDASAAEATSLEGHERRGRRVFDWENQLQVYGRFDGFDNLIGPFFKLRTYWGQPDLIQDASDGEFMSSILWRNVTFQLAAPEILPNA